MEIDQQIERHVKEFHVAQKLRLVNGETPLGETHDEAQTGKRSETRIHFAKMDPP